MNSKVYGVLKWLSAPVLPAIATLLGTIGKIWDLPIMAPIALTVGAIATCLGTIVIKSSKDFFKDKEIVPATMGVYGDGSDEDE